MHICVPLNIQLDVIAIRPDNCKMNLRALVVVLTFEIILMAFASSEIELFWGRHSE